jgi:toxin ParE1/3/4
MRAILILPLAQTDIDDIAAYTYQHWGEAQMVRYVDGLHRRFAQLAQSPQLGRQRHDIGRRYRSAIQGSHVVLYRATTKQLVVVRVLHGRMSAERHLS